MGPLLCSAQDLITFPLFTFLLQGSFPVAINLYFVQKTVDSPECKLNAILLNSAALVSPSENSSTSYAWTFGLLFHLIDPATGHWGYRVFLFCFCFFVSFCFVLAFILIKIFSRETLVKRVCSCEQIRF